MNSPARVTARVAFGAFALLLSSAGLAQDKAQPRVGDDTRAWLELQGSGHAADGAIRAQPGEIADKAYQRYLKTFDNTIPEEYKRDSFVSSGSGGS
jgi:hypothetical protein